MIKPIYYFSIFPKPSWVSFLLPSRSCPNTFMFVFTGHALIFSFALTYFPQFEGCQMDRGCVFTSYSVGKSFQKLFSFLSLSFFPPISLCFRSAACDPSRTALSTRRPTSVTSWVSAQMCQFPPTSAPQVGPGSSDDVIGYLCTRPR